VGTEALTTVIYEARSIIGSDSGLVAPASADSAPCSPSQLQHNQANQLSLVQRPKLELEPPKSLGCGGGGRQLSHRFAVMQIATRSDSQQVLGGWILWGDRDIKGLLKPGTWSRNALHHPSSHGPMGFPVLYWLSAELEQIVHDQCGVIVVGGSPKVFTTRRFDLIMDQILTSQQPWEVRRVKSRGSLTAQFCIL